MNKKFLKSEFFQQTQIQKIIQNFPRLSLNGESGDKKWKAIKRNNFIFNSEVFTELPQIPEIFKSSHKTNRSHFFKIKDLNNTIISQPKYYYK